MKREISTRESGIFEFIDGLENSLYLIPPFQREFVWEPCDIIRLWESIFNFYPIGSILCWETDIKLNIHRKPGGAILYDSPKAKKADYIYILDGQQRATSLLFSTGNGTTEKLKNRHKADLSLFFDCENRNFFFAKEFKRRQRGVDPQFLIPLSDLFHKGPSVTSTILKKPGCKKNIRDNLQQLQHAVNNYRLPLTFIRGFDIPAVSKIYELINREGKALKSIDIMIARTFRNYQYLVEEDL